MSTYELCVRKYYNFLQSSFPHALLSLKHKFANNVGLQTSRKRTVKDVSLDPRTILKHIVKKFTHQQMRSLLNLTKF